ncbi:MAG: diacylglycerol kinase family protein [Nanoarchaeota archaeon]
MAKQDLLLIVNPAAACGHKSRYHLHIEKLFGDGFRVEKHLSTGAGDIVDTAREAVGRFDTVVAVGGDGTLHHVVNGIAKKPINLGILPLGSSNGIANSFGISMDLLKAAAVIKAGKAAPVDLGTVNKHYFIGFTSIGFDAQIVSDFETNPQLKQLTLGDYSFVLPAYFVYGFKRFVEMEHKKIRATSGKAIDSHGYWAAVSNIPHYPGAWKPFPKAKTDDGYLDFLLLKEIDIGKAWTTIVASKSGSHLVLPHVAYHQVKHLTIKSEQPVALQADGEYLSTTPARIRAVPKGLRMLLP